MMARLQQFKSYSKQLYLQWFVVSQQLLSEQLDCLNQFQQAEQKWKLVMMSQYQFASQKMCLNQQQFVESSQLQCCLQLKYQNYSRCLNQSKNQLLSWLVYLQHWQCCCQLVKQLWSSQWCLWSLPSLDWRNLLLRLCFVLLRSSSQGSAFFFLQLCSWCHQSGKRSLPTGSLKVQLGNLNPGRKRRKLKAY